MKGQSEMGEDLPGVRGLFFGGRAAGREKSQSA
jgi:hypothetical protein